MSLKIISKATFATVVLNCIVGNINTKEKNGKLQVYLRVATHRKIKGVEKTDWHNVVVYGSLAKVIDKYVEKGNKILIEGEMEIWDLEDNETKKIIQKNYIRANSMDFKTGAKISLIGFCGNKIRKDEESPLYLDVQTTRKILKGDEKLDHDDWHKVVFYGKLADTIEQVDIVGKKIAIVGILETIETPSEKGYNIENTLIRARRVKFL